MVPQLSTSFTDLKAPSKTPTAFLPFVWVKSKLGWSGEESLSGSTSSNWRIGCLKSNTRGKSSICQLRVFLRQTFLLCKSLSTTMTVVIVSLRRARWHDGPSQQEMLRESGFYLLHYHPGSSLFCCPAAVQKIQLRNQTTWKLSLNWHVTIRIFIEIFLGKIHRALPCFCIFVFCIF